MTMTELKEKKMNLSKHLPKIIQTCWFNDSQKLDAGWMNTKFHLMSWGLSSFLLHKYYTNTLLITDDLGKNILIDELHLPYKSISLAQQDYKPNVEKIWVSRKIHSFASQYQPFIHVDGDVFLFKPFNNELLNDSLVAQNYEYDHPYYIQGFDEIKNVCSYLPNYIKPDNDGKLSAVNAGIIGGSNYEFYHFFEKEVNRFISKNKFVLQQLDDFRLNIFLEQFLFKKIADFKEIPITYQLKKPIGYPYNYQLDRFWDLPNSCDYIHVMNYKKNPTICEQMAQRLYIENPELYERIIEVSNELESTKVSTFVENEPKTLGIFFYRTDLINQHIGLNLNLQITSIDSLTEQIKALPESPQNAILRDTFQYELEKYQFIQSLPSVYDYVQYRKLQSLTVNEILSKSDEEILLSSVTFGEYVALVESEWKWAEINEFTGQDSAVDYTLSLQQEPSYFQVVLFCYPVSMTVKEQLSDTFTIMIIDTLQQIENNTLTIQEVLENVSQEIYLHNQTICLEELKANILTKIRYLLYQGVLVFSFA